MRLVLATTALILTAPAGSPLHAQGELGDLPSYEAAAAGLAEDPGDLDLLYAIARRAELEADSARDPAEAERLRRRAVRHYERFLLVNPDMPQVALRLGELQYRLGRPAEAEDHFERALADPALPPEIRADAERYLAAIGDELDPAGLEGSLFAGLRYQTNATIAPAEDVPTIEDFVREEPGTDAFLALRLVHAHDPGWQRRHTIETRLDLDASRFFDHDDLDSYGAGLSFGPRLELASYGAGDTAIRPHVFGGILAVDGALFSTEAGLGAEADAQLTPDLQAFALLRGVSQRFNETLGNPGLDDRDGWEYTARLSAEYRLAPAFSVGGALEAIQKDAEVEPEAFRRLGAELSATLAHGAPAGPGAGSWTTRLAIGWSEARFGAVPGGDRRRDDQIWSRLSSNLPLAPSVSLAGSLAYSERQSNRPEFEYDNVEVALGVAYRF